MPYSRRRVTGARAALGWCALGFAFVQLTLDAGVVARHPELQDPEFAARLALLRRRVAEAPNRPVLLLLGSSRTVGSFVPEKLPPVRSASGEPALVFNFSHLGAGPGMNLVELRRLLRNGIRPDWLVVEVMPPQLGDDSQSIMLATANVRDLSVTRHYRHPLKVYGNFVRTQLVPCSRYRRFLAHSAVPDWVPDAAWEAGQVQLERLGGDPTTLSAPDPALVRSRTERAREGYFPPLQDLHVVDLSDRAMHDLLTLCRRRAIPVALVLTPEGSAFQSWYSPESRRRVDAYCDALSRQYDVPLIDARDWLDDIDFIDSHHVNVRGAEEFTLRLGREVLQPLAGGKLRRKTTTDEHG